MLSEEDKLMLKLIYPNELTVDLDNMRHWDWQILIERCPRVAEFCEWERFASSDIGFILRDTPEAIEYVPTNVWKNLNPREWVEIMERSDESHRYLSLSKHKNLSKLKKLSNRCKRRLRDARCDKGN